MPAVMVVKTGELALPPPLSGMLGEVNTAVVQVGSLGENSVKVTVLPGVGLTLPLTVAVSKIEVPTTPPGEAVVVIVGVACLMVTASAGSVQRVLTATLLVSPL